MLTKAKSESVTLKHQTFDDLSNMKLVVYNGASLESL